MFGEIRNLHGEKIDYTHHTASRDSQNLVIIGHGVTGNKDRPFVVALANGLAAAGIPALRISFSGNGDSEGEFTDSNISKEVADLGAVIDKMADKTVTYVGHSMGGAVGALRASQDERIQFLVSLAGMVHTRQFAETEFGMVTPDKGNMWDDEECPLSQKYMDDLRSIESTVDHAHKVKVPWLLLHGTEDDVVPLQDSKDIHVKANKSATLIEIPGANHVFAEPHTEPMVTTVVQWLKDQYQLAQTLPVSEARVTPDGRR
ncbi:MAG: 2-succinyl-6-hydroxy-2,4-cyclohexadiene-1-carboxylate synthase [Verrucomicrobia subdivision 3 bacterium]|nr:2-succinyl-6-hydroxy-2,4-cyclohexadiene-1-carboxylate synthase [Limisphaerales bacterium]MCS1414601.1 2-succinyl-6-hydroxy-2,4-cyclohexadiene-1-carboxylate synthase [Limisphaerales bacterium]